MAKEPRKGKIYMKKIVLYSSILLFIYSMAFAASKIVFKETIHNLGDIPMDSQREHIFSFKNTGNTDLTINRVRAGCSCTGTLLTKKVLKPGESGEIKVVLHTDRRLGEITKSIYVYSNDPLHKRIRLVILGNIVKK